MGRGLSQVQLDIMEFARSHGYITPAEAVELSWTEATSGSRNAVTKVRTTASRALKRLCARGLLWHDHVTGWRYKDMRSRQILGWNVYRVPGWSACMTFMDSEQMRNSDRKYGETLVMRTTLWQQGRMGITPSSDTSTDINDLTLLMQAASLMGEEKAIGQAAS